MKFTVKIEGLKELQKTLSKKHLDAKIKNNLGHIAQNVHSALRTSVKQHYAFGVPLDHVLIDRSASVQKRGKHLSQSNLEYRFEAIPLHRFPTQVSTVAVSNKFLLRSGKSFRVIEPGHAEETSVKVVRTKGFTPAVSKEGRPGFLLKRGDSSRWRSIQNAGEPIEGTSYRRGIYVRKQEKTWRGSPRTHFLLRAPIEMLFGPSLSQMAESRAEKDPNVADALTQATLDLSYI